MSAFLRAALRAFLLSLIVPSLVQCAFINFENCLSSNLIDSNPLLLQWVPLFLDVTFNTSNPNSLVATSYGNVSGQQVEGAYPPPSDPQWHDPNVTFGKIANIGSAQKYSTLFADFKVLNYNAYNANASRFCPHLVNGSCPIGPYFHANATNPYDLPAFTVQHDFGSPYRFSTLAATIRVVSGDTNGPTVACVSANITPDLGPGITALITWLPAAILILKGVATLAAAIYSPWGSSDIFRWSSNYGRDEDLLRLVTPGFGDCLQYIQFVTLLGSLTLQFPGFFQPAVSQTAWSLLLFNESFVSHGNGTQSLVDGIYATNGTYGISTMRQLIGMTESYDVWACMAVYLLGIAVAVVVLCQLGFFGRWVHRTVTKTSEEDLRQKNLPFTVGNMIRLLFNFFILPIVAISLFQLIIAGQSPTAVVVCAAILFVISIASLGWILRIVFITKPRTYLFDDMPTVLLYGPLYNTYSDSAAPFALVPVLITFMRGVAFGAVQPSGIAQIIILAICEVIFILTLNGFRPFQNQTSMNAYHTFFAVVRLITVLLCIAFVPTLGVTEAPKGWIGYAILLLHACVLVFGFFLNAAQTLIEVTVRSFGLAGQDSHGAIRGSILNWRMLKKRRDRQALEDRGSMTSNAAMLRESQADEGRSARTRSLSASSQQLLNQTGRTPSSHRLSGFENFSNGGDPAGSPSQDADGTGPGRTSVADKLKTEETFYRPPRKRTATIDALTPGTKSRGAESGEYGYQDSPQQSSSGGREGSYEAAGFRDSPAPAYFRDRADSDSNAPRTDYAVREVDQYYRGPALSDQPTRKLKTGPADPEGPAASAQSWFQRLLFGVKGNKQKDTGKGFEVVRSSRMSPGMQQEPVGNEALEMQTSPPMNQEPYRDSPPMHQGEVQSAAGAERSRSVGEQSDGRPYGYDGQFGGPLPGLAFSTGNSMPNNAVSPNRMHPGLRAEQPATDRSLDAQGLRSRPSHETQASSDYNRPSSEYPDGSSRYPSGIPLSSHYPSGTAPSLGPIETVGDIDMPSRFSSRRSANLDNVDIGTTEGGQEWLRAVDNLNWGHNNPAAQPTALQPSMSRDRNYRQRGATPTIPIRNSRRTPSQDQVPTVSPERGADTAFGAYDSPPHLPDFLSLGGGDERPSSFFNTSHHRAADSIHRNSFGANAALQASSAEFMATSPPEGGAGFGASGGQR